MSDQDWKPIVFKKKTKPISNPNSQPKLHIQYDNTRKIEKNAEDGDLGVIKITHDLKIKIQQARQQKGWTQKELANQCQMPESKIKEYENGKYVPLSQDLVKMSKVLGVTLRNEQN